MASPLTVGGLFSGIGGWELGLERAGMKVAWHCESDPFCRKVLERHWPDVPCFDDVTTLSHPPYVDVIAGGFPCQDLSVAGYQAGLDGARSGLWAEMLRIACEVRPRYVLIENVPNLLYGDGGSWMRRVLCDLAACGFDAEWDCLPASAFGAPHRRDRIWIVAYPCGSGLEGRQRTEASRETLGLSAADNGGSWAQGPTMAGGCGVGYGLSDWVDRIRSLGNALVPEVAEWIGRRVVEHEAITHP